MLCLKRVMHTNRIFFSAADTLLLTKSIRSIQLHLKRMDFFSVRYTMACVLLRICRYGEVCFAVPTAKMIHETSLPSQFQDISEVLFSVSFMVYKDTMLPKNVRQREVGFVKTLFIHSLMKFIRMREH